MSNIDTREKYRNALEAIAREECTHPEELARDVLWNTSKWRMERNQVSIGDRYGRLEVIYDCGLVGRDLSTNRKAHIWLCLCDCGNTHCVDARSLTSGGTRSCGCLRRELTKAFTRARSEYNRGHNFVRNLERAIARLRKAAQLRKVRVRKEKAKKSLEETKRKLIPYAGHDGTGTAAGATGYSWKRALGERVGNGM